MNALIPVRCPIAVPDKADMACMTQRYRSLPRRDQSDRSICRSGSGGNPNGVYSSVYRSGTQGAVLPAGWGTSR